MTGRRDEMWALAATALAEVEQQRWPVPTIADGSVLIAVRYSGVSSGTERSALLGLIPHFGDMPFVTGYQCVGRVVAVGDGVSDFRPGDAVAAHCYGTHAEYTVADTDYVHRLPNDDALSPLSSLFVQFAVAANALNHAAVSAGDVVLVVGQGLIGQATALLARLRGAFVIATDLQEARMIAAQRVADLVIDQRTDALVDGVLRHSPAGVDVVIESTGAVGAIDGAMDCVRKYGTFVFEGYYTREFTFNFSAAHNRQIKAVFPSSVGSRALRDSVLRLMASGAIAESAFAPTVLPWHAAAEPYVGLLTGAEPGQINALILDWEGAADRAEAQSDAGRAFASPTARAGAC